MGHNGNGNGNSAQQQGTLALRGVHDADGMDALSRSLVAQAKDSAGDYLVGVLVVLIGIDGHIISAGGDRGPVPISSLMADVLRDAFGKEA